MGSTHIPDFQRVISSCFEMKTSCSTTSAQKSLKSSPKFCSTHTKLLKNTFKTLIFLFFLFRCGKQRRQKINLWQLTSARWGRMGLSVKKGEKKPPKKTSQGSAKYFKAATAECRICSEGGLGYLYGILGTHPARHDPRVLQADLNTEESKKKNQKLQFFSSERASHRGLEELHKQNLLALGGGNKFFFFFFFSFSVVLFQNNL